MIRSDSFVADIFICLAADHASLRQINGARAQLSNFQGPLLNIKELKTDNKTYLKDGKVQFFGITASY